MRFPAAPAAEAILLPAAAVWAKPPSLDEGGAAEDEEEGDGEREGYTEGDGEEEGGEEGAATGAEEGEEGESPGWFPWNRAMGPSPYCLRSCSHSLFS